jgi:hypothetical protein
LRYFWRKSSVLLLVFGLWGCAQQSSLESSLAPDPKLVEQKGLQAAQGTVKGLPQDFPAIIPLYPGATLMQVQGTSTMWAIADDLTKLENFYRQAFEQGKWDLANTDSDTKNADPSLTAIVAKKDNVEVTLTFSPGAAPPAKTSTQGKVGTTYILAYRLLSAPSTPPVQPELNSTAPSPQDNPDLTTPAGSDNPPPTASETSALITQLETLGVFQASEFNATQVITRRQFARWLLTAHNKIYGDRPDQQIRLANSSSKPVFTDVPASNPDFAIIQGLAEAGFIPSSLTNATNALTFRPDAPLTREALIAWKVPLDRRQALPTTTLDQITETWGFQDAAKIETRALQALYIDFQNGDQANVRRMFGYTTLFQPTKTVTQQEAAIAISYFGFQGEGLSVTEALAK